MRKPRIEIKIDTDWKTPRQELEALLQAYQEVARGIDEAFRQEDLTDTIADTVRLRRQTEAFGHQISYLRMNLGGLKASFAEAFAPIGNLILPAVNKAISRLRSFLHALGAAFAAVTQNVRGNAEANDEAAESYKSLGTAAKRSLAGFDQLERLGGSAGSGTVSAYDPMTHLTEDMKAMAARILRFLQPLLDIDLTPLKTALQKLWAAAKPVLEQLGELLEYVWQAVAAPFIAWCAETLFPALTDTLSAALTAVGNAAGPVVTGVKLVHDALQGVVGFIRGILLGALESLKQLFTELAAQMQEKGDAIATIFHGIRTVIQSLWTALEPIFQKIYDRFSQTFTGIGRVATQVFGGLLEGLAGVAEFLAGIFTNDWKRAWNGILLFLKSVVNSLIGLLNAMLVKLTSALNAVVNAVGKVKFTVPGWVPGIGGQTYRIPMQGFQAPQIPYLAKGAVLPANKPFLAMVGDQRSGTNVEAPLTTIRQAVAEVMEDYASANMAGHNATVAVLREILQAVLGIEIGDEVIAAAGARYHAKMAMVTGG